MDIQNLVAQVQQIVTLYGLRVISALVILIVGKFAAGLLRKIVIGSAKRAKADPLIGSFLANIASVATLVFVFIAALSRLGVETTSFIAIIGAAGLAIGLAFQGSLSNFASGFLMIIFRPFRVGDYIEGGGVSGTVQEIHVFTTTLISPDNKKIIVPNSKITGDNIVNYTSEDKRRVDMVIGVSYNDDIDKVKKLLTEVVTTFPGVLQDPLPQIALMELGENRVNFVVRPWAKPGDYWGVLFGLNEAIKKRFDKEGVSIPFPQRDVHLYQKQ